MVLSGCRMLVLFGVFSVVFVDSKWFSVVLPVGFRSFQWLL